MTDGPYRWVAHPVYIANWLIAAGLVVAARVPAAPGGGLLLAVAAVYVVLAVREGRQLRGAPTRPGHGLSAMAVARSERSTWLSVVALLAAQILVGVSR